MTVGESALAERRYRCKARFGNRDDRRPSQARRLTSSTLRVWRWQKRVAALYALRQKHRHLYPTLRVWSGPSGRVRFDFAVAEYRAISRRPDTCDRGCAG